MTQFEKDVYSNFSGIASRLSKIETLLNEDHKELHGNGKLGLIDSVKQLDKKITALEIKSKLNAGVASTIISLIAWLLTTAVALYGALRHTT